MGIAELRLANPGVDVWLPGEGTPIRIPSRFILPDAPRTGVVVNLPEMRIYHYPEVGSVVHTWPISIGRVGWDTPLGKTTVVRKKTLPTWYPPAAATPAGGLPPALDRDRVDEALATANGVPVAVARRPAVLAAPVGDTAH